MSKRSRFTSTFTVLFSGAALAMAALACSGSDDDKGGAGPGGGAGGSGGGPGGFGSYTLDNVCEQTAPRQCGDARACCDSSGVGYDQAGCEAGMLRDCESAVAKVKAGKMSFNPGSVDACLATLRAVYQKCEFSFAELVEIGDIGDACQVFVGNIEEGGACDDDIECKQPSDAKTFALCTGGKCTLESLIEVGEAQDCDENTSCSPGLYCAFDFESGSEEAKCQKVKAIGEACYWPGECASWNCQDGKCEEAGKISVANAAVCKGEEDESGD